MLKIRLKRLGAKKRPFYRIVVADDKKPRQGKSVEELGWYDPLTKPARVEFDTEKAESWVAKGARMSDTVASLYSQVKAGLLGSATPVAPVAAEAKAPKVEAAPVVEEPVAETVEEPVAEEPTEETEQS